MPFLRQLLRWHYPLAVAGVVGLILGLRIFLGIRYVANQPQLDDTCTTDWLQSWAQGIHDWHFILVRHNGHPMELYYLANLGQFLLNGYWDGRLDFLVFAIIHAAYAWIAIMTFTDLLRPGDRGWIMAVIFFLFAVPFAGHRISWGLLWPDSAMMALSLAALWLAAYRSGTWWGIILTLGLAVLAALNTAAGCLGALAVFGLVVFRSLLVRRCTPRDVVLALGSLAIFLVQYLTFHQGGQTGLGEALNAFLRALAWPTFFLPAIGFVTLVPLVGLTLKQIYSPSFRGREAIFLTGVGALIFLVSLATGIARGDNQTGGMPSGRYTDIFVMVPLFCLTSLCLLHRAEKLARRWAWGLFIYGWLCLQLIGFCILIFYRVIPFISADSGEWEDGHNQLLLRDVARGIPHPELARDTVLAKELIVPSLVAQARGTQPVSAMTTPMISGFPLLTGSQGNYLIDGFDPIYHQRPGQTYLGSYDVQNPPPTKKWFMSGTFRPSTRYLTFDFLVDKTARSKLYRLDGLEVVLVDETSGHREELLPKLSHQFPYLFRDWELVYALVVPGHLYRVESYAAPVRWEEWIALGEPFESGNLTPFIVGLSQSGKLICMLALALLTLSFGIRWLEVETELSTSRSSGSTQPKADMAAI